MSPLPLSPLTLDAVQAAAIRTARHRPDVNPVLDELVMQLGKVAEAGQALVDVDAHRGDPLVGALLDLAALALRWVEDLEESR